MGAADVVIGKISSRCPDVRDIIPCGGTGSSIVWVVDVGYVPAHCEDLGQITQ